MEAQDIISKMVDHLKQIEGVTALVLGGSRARGTDNPNSDIDIGIYYDSGKGLDVAHIGRVSAAVDDGKRDNLITELGGWGPWINGGGWLTVDQTPVDFIFRDQNKASKVIEQCIRGEITIDYQPGHPHGFINSIYFAEIALSKVLWDPTGIIGELKKNANPFPSVFKEAMIQKFLWEASFSLENARKGIYKKDGSYIAGCCFRAVSCLNQVLFALNETYWMNEKGAAAIADSFVMAPSKYAGRINNVFASFTENQEDLEKALSGLRELIQETEALI